MRAGADRKTRPHAAIQIRSKVNIPGSSSMQSKKQCQGRVWRCGRHDALAPPEVWVYEQTQRGSRRG